MAGRRSGLGRGLDALIGPADAFPPVAEEQTGLQQVEIGRIEPNPFQPRRQMAPEELEALAASIQAHGLLQPLVVTALPAAGGAPRYQLIAGERRWQAAKLAGLVRVPVVVREATDRERLELALVENVQRADLNPLEEATAYRQLTEAFGLTQEEVARRVGKSRVAVSNTLRLLDLTAAVQRALLDGSISEGHGRALAGLRHPEQQTEALQQVLAQHLSVRQTEALVRRLQAPAATRRRAPRAAAADELQERLQQALGTRVGLTRGPRGGKLVIYFYDDEQLQHLYERLAPD